MGTSYNTNVVIDGLVGCWDAGNRRSYPGAGTTWTDPVGGIKGTLENEDDDALNFNSFKGGYLEFDGTDGRVDCGDAGVDNDLIVDWGELTVCVWALAIQGSQSSYGLVYLGNPFEFSIAPPAHQRFIWATIDGTSLTADVGCMDPYWGKWAHYAVRWVTGTDNYRLYINGEVIKTGTFNDTHISPGSNPPLYFAYRGTGKCLEGNIGSVYIYDRSLSDDEIKQNYEATKNRFLPRITKSGMFANWDAGDPQSYNGGQTWTDTANGFTGALNNGGDGSLTFDPANGGSLEFDGTDDRIGPITLPGDYSSTARSVIVWVAVDIYTSGSAEWTILNSAADKFSVSMGQSNYSGGFLFRSAVTNTSTYRGGFSTSGLVDGSWQCFAFTINASNEIVAMYHNGESKSNTISNAMNLQSATYIGSSSSGGYMLGNIGTVRFYTKTLSAAEILDNYQKTKARFGH